MDTSKLRKFASFARSALIEQVGTRLKTVLAEKSLARRESLNVVKELEAKIKELGEKRLIETVAYTWFNRFCALRYMDVNRYTRIGVLSPADGQFQPEILAEAKMGHIDEDLVPAVTRMRVLKLLDGSDPSNDPQGEAYRLLLVAVCNYYHALMPFMFEKIADYTELLLPDDLLSGSSIPAYTREALLPINCSPEHTEESVEVIGWLYQFYIADKKDKVFENLNKGTKITAENIPAATQLFTPHWIVRYLVENSLGRLWMLNHPNSKLIERMVYYIKPEEPETDFLKITSPEEIKVCDPACGSGHMLTYAFDLLYEIYREEQYAEPEIPSLILRNNLFGIEIDHRAGALAAFALTMKAREKDKRFFTRNSKPDASGKDFSSFDNQKSQIPNPNVCVLENIFIAPEDLSAYIDKVDRDVFNGGLQGVVNQWEEADNFGSLIRPLVTDVSDVLELLRERRMGQDLFLAGVHQKALKALRQADYLSPKYHVVVANPPYFGSGGMNSSMKTFANKNYKNSKSDLFAMFIERSFDLVMHRGYTGMITMQSWIFLTSYEDLRHFIIEHENLITFAHFGSKAFDSIGGEVVATCGFTMQKGNSDTAGDYIRLTDGRSEAEKRKLLLEAIGDPSHVSRFRVDKSKFKQITGIPIAYWASDSTRNAFSKNKPLTSYFPVKEGTTTGDTKRFLRLWFEVSQGRIGFDFPSVEIAQKSGRKWFPYLKGGEFRRWYGNHDYIVNWLNDGQEIREYSGSTPRGTDFYFLPNLNWTKVSSSSFSVRYTPKGFCFDTGGLAMFPPENQLFIVLGLLNSAVVKQLVSALSLTLNYTVGNIGTLPFKQDIRDARRVSEIAIRCVELAREDWDMKETSFDFSKSPLLLKKQHLLCDAFREHANRKNTAQRELRLLEEENNAIFIEEYGLQNELAPEVNANEITIAPTDTMGLAESFASYFVGCIFGRYSLDKDGIILANQGETVTDFRKLVPNPTFEPDEDNVLPMLAGDWFGDHITERFKAFLKVTFGTEHYEENLKFLEDALYPDNLTTKKRKTIRDYFLKDFYNHHIKLYKKRPIYWLFSSPKGTFNALIYMHRYRPDTVGTVLYYLRDFRDTLTHHADHQQMLADSARASNSEKTQAIKDVAAIKKQLKELEDYEKTLFDVAARKIDIDLDDGVKHNYQLFGSVLRKIPGLDAKDD